MVECLDAAGISRVAFDAYFPKLVYPGAGGTGQSSVAPTWLSGGLVFYDATTGVIDPADDLAAGMRVQTGPEPGLTGGDAARAWMAANTVFLRVPPALGDCQVMDTARFCTFGRFAGQELHFTAHYQDPAAATCKGTWYPDPATTVKADLPAASVRAYCDQQLVVESFVTNEPYVCPASPYTVTELSHFRSDRLVACLGSGTISVLAYVPVPVASATGSIWDGTPHWLVGNEMTGMVVLGWPDSAYTYWLVRIPPRLGACTLQSNDPASCPFRPFAGKWVTITGHLADAASATCKATWTNPAPKPPFFTTAYVRQYCREQFVISATPTLAKAPARP